MKTGKQEPTFSVIGESAYSLSDEVVEMFEAEAGATFYPCQKYEMGLFLARMANGAPAAMTIGISKPRQNGKSYGARFYAVYMGVFEHRAVLYSAHHSTTTNKMFKALCNLFESPERFPDFAEDVKSISHARGYEGIYFKDWVDEDGEVHEGGCIEFSTRTNSGQRGGTYSVIVIDEAQELTAEQQEAMLPVISAAASVSDVRKMPQQIYIGTPPGPTCRGTVFREMHTAAHSNEPGKAWWIEWGVEAKDIAGAVPNAETAVELAYMTNPAMGYRIAEDTIVNEYENMSVDGFARERLGWWSPVAVARQEYVLNAAAWMRCRSDLPKPEGKTAYGVKFSTDGSEVVLCGAVCPKEGPARISLIERQSTAIGTRWLADWLRARYGRASCVVIDGRNGVDVLVDRISDVWRVKGSIIRPKASDVIAAVSGLENDVNEQAVTWYSGQEQLSASATGSVKRPISGGYGFGGDDPTPIEAAALALWGARTSKRDPTKKMRIG